MEFFPLPTSTGGAFPPRDGYFVKCPSHFRQILGRPHELFLQSLPKEERLSMDPAGFSAMPFFWEEKWIVICGIQVEGYCDRKRTKKVIGKDFNPLLPISAFIDLVREHRRNITTTKPSVQALSAVEAQEFVSVTMHEIRRLNLQIKSQSEELVTKAKQQNLSQDIAYQIQNVFGTSTLISTRLDAYDFHVNPEAFTFERRKPIPIYGKFEKAKHCLSVLALRSQVDISFKGQSRLSVRGIPVLEIVPFVLLENAIKYSPPRQKVEVSFANTHATGISTLEVSVTSVGPKLQPGEAERIFDNKFRGEFAKRVRVGTGTGLHFAKLVCDLHEVKLRAHSYGTEHIRVDDIPYTTFQVTLSFPLHPSGKVDQETDDQ
jgi:Histidine kinase-, DNA gyrase B-, and HSP90-like ATPase